MGSESRDPSPRPRGLRRSGELSIDEETEAREGDAPTRLLCPWPSPRVWGPGFASPHNPMRKVGAGYHVALRATGVGECPVSVCHGYLEAKGCWQLPRQSPSWGVASPGRPCQASLSHSLQCKEMGHPTPVARARNLARCNLAGDSPVTVRMCGPHWRPLRKSTECALKEDKTATLERLSPLSGVPAYQLPPALQAQG